MSIQRSQSQSSVSNIRNARDTRASIGVLLPKSEKLLQLAKEKRSIEPQKLKQMRQIFASSPLPVERLAESFAALGHDPRQDVSYQDFLSDYELSDAPSGLLDFEHFALLFIAYEEKLRVEDDALRRLDLKIAFEYFDSNRGTRPMNRASHDVLNRWNDRCR